MNSNKKKSLIYRILRWTFIYGILPVVIFYIIIAIWHPEKSFIDRAFQRVESDTGIRITYGNIDVTVLGKLKLQNIDVQQIRDQTFSVNGTEVSVKPKHIFSADQLLISIAWQSLVRGFAGVKYVADAYAGDITGYLEAPVFNTKAPMHLTSAWSKIDLNLLQKDFPDLMVNSGVSNGDADMEVIPVVQDSLKGTVNLNIDEMEYQLPEKLSSTLSMSGIEKVESKLLIEGQQITCQEVWARSAMGTMNLTGTIQRGATPETTHLNLDLKFYTHEPDQAPDLSQYIPIKIKGTAARPQPEFLGVPLNYNKLNSMF